jgi:hypothetical protein
MPDNSEGDARTRARLAIWIVALSIVGIALASAVALIFATPDNRPEMARLVFASVLPLLGTWVGTVLAFYFVRENLQAATESTARLVGRIQPRTPVLEVMIPKARIISYDLPTGADVRAVPLVELYNKMTTGKVGRIPIFNASGAVLYVVHMAMLDGFASSLQPPKDPAALTEMMADLLDKPDLKSLVEAIGFVGPNAVVEEARMAMRSVEGCNDVFVTTSGKKDDPVIGWLTNTDLAGME